MCSRYNIRDFSAREAVIALAAWRKRRRLFAFRRENRPATIASVAADSRIAERFRRNPTDRGWQDGKSNEIMKGYTHV
jgi:hypothetical protein